MLESPELKKLAHIEDCRLHGRVEVKSIPTAKFRKPTIELHVHQSDRNVVDWSQFSIESIE